MNSFNSEDLLLTTCPNHQGLGYSLLIVDPKTGLASSEPSKSLDSGILGASGVAMMDGSFACGVQTGIKGASALVLLDQGWEPIRTISLQDHCDVHSIIPYEEGVLYVATGSNSLIYLNLSTENPQSSVIWRADDLDTDSQHLNSVTVWHGSIIVSMFGEKKSGSWKNSQCGQIVNIDNGNILSDGEFHPHSLTAHDGSLYWLESGRGKIKRLDSSQTDAVSLVSLDGYLRGLAFGEDHLYVGASAQRLASKSRGIRSESLDSINQVDTSRIYCLNKTDLSVISTLDFGYSPAQEIYDVVACPLPTELPYEPIQKIAVDRLMELHNNSDLSPDLLRTAEQLVDEGSLQTALTLLRLVEASNYHGGDYHYLKGYCLHHLGLDRQNALTHYSAAEASGVNHEWLQFNKGILLEAMGQPEEAKAQLSMAATTNPAIQVTIDAWMKSRPDC